jgi:hypothetical protein
LQAFQEAPETRKELDKLQARPDENISGPKKEFAAYYDIIQVPK